MTNLGVIIGIILAVLGGLVSIAIALVAYVINSLAYMRLNKKLGACHPVLAWIPILQELVHGKLADTVSLKLDGKKKSLSRQLTLSMILMLITWLALLICSLLGMLLSMWDAAGVVLILLAVAVALVTVVTVAALVWFLVVWYIAFFRTSRAFLPTWGSWLALVVLVLWPQLSGVVLLIMSFMKLKTDDMIEGTYTE